jgi:DNA polymerase-1
MPNKLTFLVDADMLLYSACAGCEDCVDWGNDLTTIETDLGAAKKKFLGYLKKYTADALLLLHYKGKYEYIMCISDAENFRKVILPTYKSGRTKRKPCGYKFLREWVEETYKVVKQPMLEADDCLGILITSMKDVVIISGDKDMRTLPGRFYNFSKEELYDTDIATANWHWLYQTLIGDSTDGYTGLPGCGPKSAEKILNAECSWEAVVAAYETKGLTEEDALLQARVARILRTEDYDGKVIKLWSPKGMDRECISAPKDSTKTVDK